MYEKVLRLCSLNNLINWLTQSCRASRYLFIVGGFSDVLQKASCVEAVRAMESGVEGSAQCKVHKVFPGVLTLLHLTVHRACVIAFPINMVHLRQVSRILKGKKTEVIPK